MRPYHGCLNMPRSKGGFLKASVRLRQKKYHITEGGIKIDDSDKKRRKRQPNENIRVHKLFESSRGGYINGQAFVMLF